MDAPSQHWSPDWSALWRFGACWAGRPVGGLLLPGSERLKIMTGVVGQLMATHPVLPGALQTHAFIQSTAVKDALRATREARLASGVADLWHDPGHRGTTPVIDLMELQRHAESRLWQDLLIQLKPRALGLLRAQGVGDADAEDIFAESMAGMVKPRKDGTAVIQDLQVYEQVPSLFLSIVRRRTINHIRDRNAEKRAVHSTVSLHAGESSEDITAHSTFAGWAAEAADPLHGMTMARLAEECAEGLSSLQQRILSVLYVEESADYMEVASAPWFVQAMGLKASASEATRRRALDRVHDGALDHLAQSLGIARQES
jgi:DNA-directed RNA polymerase specialized sigma24 family protein